MNLGKYEIETYYVVVGGQTQTRQRVVYTANNVLRHVFQL